MHSVIGPQKLRLMIALVEVDARKLQGSNLPVIVVAELELDSVNPPPDTIEEVKKEKNRYRKPQAND